MNIMETDETAPEAADITRLLLDEREFVLIGTAHVSQASVDIVRRAIVDENPDTVCVELDEQRHKALRNPRHWESLNLLQVLRKGQAPFLLANLVLSAFQKRMGLQTGVKPGAELAAAAETAEKFDKKVSLVDRDIRTTLLRAWRTASLWKKFNLLASLFASMFESGKIDEEELARLRQTDTLSAMLDEMAQFLPSVKRILVDERDLYMAYKIRNAPGQKVMAVVGAAHIPGITRHLRQPIDPGQIASISIIPPKPTISKLLPWIIPAVVVLLFVIGFLSGDYEKMASAAIAWVLANGLLSGLGAMLAFGHPLTVLSAFIAAPLTSLNPTIGAGFVTGFVQAGLVPPQVRDLEKVGEDISRLSGWWRNRLTRVLLVFLLSSLGSAIGTLVAFGWLKNLL
ncbi:MAG TPA: TraB/GumN family protein [Desulfuromonadales bacterium]|nr:TraB/GumN family protein [Desulfuromonadales bacterium]